MAQSRKAKPYLANFHDKAVYSQLCSRITKSHASFWTGYRIVNNECTFHINGFQIDTDGRWFHSVGGERESQSVGGGAPSRSLTFTPGCCSGSSSCPPSPTPPSGTSTSTTTKTIPLICPWVVMSHYHTLWVTCYSQPMSTNTLWRTIQCYFDLNWILVSWIIN